MKNKIFHSAFIFILVFTLFLTGCASNSGETTEPEGKGNPDVSLENVPERFAKGEGAKIKPRSKL